MITAMLLGSASFAQFRANDQTGINTFEAPKSEKAFEGLKTTIGGGFTQGYQNLNHGNKANPKIVAGVNQNKLIPLAEGFNLASANLALQTELSDGIALNMELYLASRHHNETWVKGGYLQIDKIPFLRWTLLDNIMKYTTLKVGQMDVNFGDAHFRRTDGGNAILNPFSDNLIMDDFATEVGVEADINYNGIIGVVGITNGLLKGSVTQVNEYLANPLVPGTVDASDGNRHASIVGKVGYDKELTEKLRVRATVSAYYNAGAISNTLLSGDRTGSNYYGVMEYLAPSSATFSSGRYSPGFSDKITAYMGNLFIKFHGLESFSTIEQVSGRSASDILGERTAKQVASELIFRFGKDECFYIGGRANRLIAEVAGTTPTNGYEISINRYAGSIGWFVTKNVLAKVEYVGQQYSGFTKSDIRNHGWFDGINAQAVIGF